MAIDAASPTDGLLRDGLELHRQGRLDEALTRYEAALSVQPQHFAALRLSALAAFQQEDAPRALMLIDQAIRVNPRSAAAHHDRGNVLRRLNRVEEAIAGYDAAIELTAEFTDAHGNRGEALFSLGRFAAAVASFDQALEGRAGRADAEILNFRGSALAALQKYDEALASYDRAVEMSPDFSEAHCNRANVLAHCERWDAALEGYDRAIAARADYAESHCSRGLVLQRLNRLDEALSSYDRALALQPDFARAHVNRGMVSLLTGDFEQGWDDYEWRWKLENSSFIRQHRIPRQPRWDGRESLSGKTLLMQSEQGLGDTLQFCRYARLAADLGATVVLEVQPPLAALMATLEGVARVVVPGDELPQCDFYIPLMSLPLAFHTTLSAIPGPVPYLKSCGAKSAFWRETLGEKTRPRVGLVWSGAVRAGHPDPWWVDGRRNVPLAAFACFESADIEFYSLQKGQPAESELAELAAGGWDGPRIQDFTHLLRDFSDTAALVEQMDLVVSVDTATAHLAGALGKPVWLLNRFDTCWRWLTDRTDSPWYPSARIYRQETPGDWERVLGRVRLDLALKFPADLDRAAAPRPDLPLAFLKQTSALLGAGHWADALKSIDRAFLLGADSAEAHTLRGLSQAGLEYRQEALQSYQTAIERDPAYVPAHINLGILLRKCRRPAGALQSYDAALELKPDSFEALCNRAAVLIDLRRFDEALSDCSRARAASPDRPEIHMHEATALLGLGRYPQALRGFDSAIAFRADDAAAHAGRSGVLQNLHRHAEALASADRAVALAPMLAAGHFNRGVALRDLARLEEAVASFETARSLQPEDPETNCNLGGLLLLSGRYEAGWEFYEWRSRLPGAPVMHRTPRPRWNGAAAIRGKTLFVYPDQGLGDTIQFSRYAKLAELEGADVVMSVQSGLRRLLSTLSPTIRILAETEVPGEYDYHCPLASLPRAFKTNVDNIPAPVPHLSADGDRTGFWRRRLGADGFKIGICWQGSTTLIGRSFPLHLFRGISSLPSVRLISLQRGEGTEQLAGLTRPCMVEVPGEDFDSGADAFLDTAAIMQSLDLVITCDTSIAHLAGALGRPVWVALKRVPDWRWMLEREDSPWYPAARLFRQKAAGNWQDVFDAMHGELISLLG